MSLKAVIKYINRKPQVEKGIGKFVDRATKKSSLAMEASIKAVATYAFNQRTGHLRRSIRANTSLPFGKAQVEINPVREGADVNYGVHLEYGTRYIAPRAFIRRGVKQAEKKIQQIFKEEARDVHDGASGIK